MRVFTPVVFGVIVTCIVGSAAAACPSASECSDTSDWRYNSVGAVKGAVVRGSYIHDTPAEALTICGSQVLSAYAERLGCSFVHKSCAPEYITRVDLLEANEVHDSNLNTNALCGHSEGVVTLSANAGRIVLWNNYFTDGAEGVLGNLNNDDKRFLVVGNRFERFTRRYSVAQGVDPAAAGFVFYDNVWVDVP